MSDEFRTTVSLTLWSGSTQEAQAAVQTVTNAVPEEDRGSVLASIEYQPDGRPAPPEPPELDEPEP